MLPSVVPCAGVLRTASATAGQTGWSSTSVTIGLVVVGGAGSGFRVSLHLSGVRSSVGLPRSTQLSSSEDACTPTLSQIPFRS